MAQSAGKKKPVASMLVIGIISVTLYVMLLYNQDTINEYFGRGGIYAFLPIATAFIFSIIHGSFTGKFWSVLGIEASKRKREIK